jgi:membrane protein implicated in regulation of membrane protease activity
LPLDDPLTSTVIVIVVIAACLLILYAMRGRRKRIKKAPEEEKSQASLRGLPFKVMKSISSDDAGRAKDELRILDLERT